MGKLWGGKQRRITIIPRSAYGDNSSRIFVADDVVYRSPMNVFYLNGKEVGSYNERTHFYKSEDIRDEK